MVKKKSIICTQTCIIWFPYKNLTAALILNHKSEMHSLINEESTLFQRDFQEKNEYSELVIGD